MYFFDETESKYDWKENKNNIHKQKKSNPCWKMKCKSTLYVKNK